MSMNKLLSDKGSVSYSKDSFGIPKDERVWHLNLSKYGSDYIVTSTGKYLFCYFCTETSDLESKYLGCIDTESGCLVWSKPRRAISTYDDGLIVSETFLTAMNQVFNIVDGELIYDFNEKFLTLENLQLDDEIYHSFSYKNRVCRVSNKNPEQGLELNLKTGKYEPITFEAPFNVGFIKSIDEDVLYISEEDEHYSLVRARKSSNQFKAIYKIEDGYYCNQRFIYSYNDELQTIKVFNIKNGEAIKELELDGVIASVVANQYYYLYVTDEELYVVTIGKDATISSFDAESLALNWQKSFYDYEVGFDDYRKSVSVAQFGCIAGDLIFLSLGQYAHENPHIVAIDRFNGNLVWKKRAAKAQALTVIQNKLIYSSLSDGISCFEMEGEPYYSPDNPKR